MPRTGFDSLSSQREFLILGKEKVWNVKIDTDQDAIEAISVAQGLAVPVPTFL